MLLLLPGRGGRGLPLVHCCLLQAVAAAAAAAAAAAVAAVTAAAAAVAAEAEAAHKKLTIMLGMMMVSRTAGRARVFRCMAYM